MGRKSTKENKNIYQEIRESLDLTRQQASELLEFISEDRLEKIESKKSEIRTDEVLKMAEAYKRADLTNYYCSHECPIGKKYIPAAQVKDLSQITLEMLATLNALDKQKNRLIEITVDGKISQEEKLDFENIRKQLEDMQKTITSLTIWVDSKMHK